MLPAGMLRRQDAPPLPTQSMTLSKNSLLLSDSLETFVDACGLHNLGAVLSATIADGDSDRNVIERLSRANAESRPAFLQWLRDAGVQRLQDRQALANALSKRERVRNLQPVERALIDRSSTPPLCVQSTYGLCNQLRVLLSYRAMAQSQGRLLILVWHNCSAACPARYRDLFEPLEGAVVLDSLAELALITPKLTPLNPSVHGSTYSCHPDVIGRPSEIDMWAE